MNLIIESIAAHGGRAEVVERKGAGHPDTLCDAIAERVCIRLCEHYLRELGEILHHNVDKVLLCGGTSRAAFGGGELLEPIEVYLGGRATQEWCGREIPVHDLAVSACRDVLRERLPALDVDRHVRVFSRLRPGSTDLKSLFARGQRVPLANDTSCGVGFAPLTELQRIVRDVEQAINAPSTKRSRPAIGSDVKVMGIRHDDAIDLVIGCAMIGRHLSGIDEYVAARDSVQDLAVGVAAGITRLPVRVAVNAADDIAAGHVFLTVTGSSAEAGDDGEVGRGNRANGLITPHRPMTMEAAAGKNPLNHVGKLYNVAANRIAESLVTKLPGVGAEVTLVSRIGHPIDDPALAYVRISGLGSSVMGSLRDTIEEAVHAGLQQLPQLRDALLSGALSVY